MVAATTGHDPVVIETTWTLKQLHAVWDASHIRRGSTVSLVTNFINGIFGSKKGPRKRK